MEKEPPGRRTARETVSARLRGAQWRWKQRTQLRARTRGAKDADVAVSHSGSVTSRHPNPPAEAAAYAAFFRRLFNDPSFFDLYGASLNENTSPHARGKKWAKRRRALVSLWIELLIRGETSPRQVAQGDNAANFDAVSEKTYERLLKGRAKQDSPPFLLDGASVKPRRIAQPRNWDQPHAVKGEPQHPEIFEMLDREKEGYLGLPAIDRPSPLIPGHEAPTLHPQFVRSLTTLRDELLTRIQPLTKDPEFNDQAQTLHDDIKFRWWPFRTLHHYISQDVALEWWLEKSPATREAILADKIGFTFNRSTAKSLVAAHKAARCEPVLSNSAIALILARDAGSIGWREDAATTAKARIVAAETGLSLGQLESRLETALHVEMAAAYQALGDAANTRAWLHKTRTRLGQHPDEWLDNLAKNVAEGQPARIHAQSIGGPAYYEIIALRD